MFAVFVQTPNGREYYAAGEFVSKIAQASVYCQETAEWIADRIGGHITSANHWFHD